MNVSTQIHSYILDVVFQIPVKIMFMVISYDISEDKRRTKIHKILKSYGQWVQYSVFECQLTETQYAKLRSRLYKLIKPKNEKKP